MPALTSACSMISGRFYFANISYSLGTRQKTSVDLKWASGAGTREEGFKCSYHNREGFHTSMRKYA